MFVFLEIIIEVYFREIIKIINFHQFAQHLHELSVIYCSLVNGLGVMAIKYMRQK